jgi:hypothetical protein
MPSNAIRQRDSAGLQDAVDRLVGGLKQMIDKEASGSTIKLANATKQDEVVVKKLVSALSGPMPFAHQININESPSKFRFMMGRDVFSDDVVL